MKRVLLICLCCLGLSSCYLKHSDYPDYDTDSQPFFRTQWYCTEHNGQTLRYSYEDIIVFDFDLYRSNNFSIYASKGSTISESFLNSESYNLTRASETTWTLQSYRYRDKGLCDIVIHLLYGSNYVANISIYDTEDRLVDQFHVVKASNDDIIDLVQYE
jgi:hypothetical protein